MPRRLVTTVMGHGTVPGSPPLTPLGTCQHSRPTPGTNIGTRLSWSLWDYQSTVATDARHCGHLPVTPMIPHLPAQQQHQSTHKHPHSDPLPVSATNAGGSSSNWTTLRIHSDCISVGVWGQASCLTYPPPSSTHRQFTGGSGFFFCISLARRASPGPSRANMPHYSPSNPCSTTACRSS
jgi:hypothetical protein